MRLTINLATRTYLNNGQLNLVFSVILVLLLFFLVVNIKEIASNIGESSRIKSELHALEQKSANKGKMVPEAEYQNMLARIRFSNGIIYRKSFRWLELLDKLETVTPEGISLTIIEPDLKGKPLKVSGTALNFGRLRQLLENMENSSNFSDIYLVSQADARVGDTQKGIIFNINCQVKI
ncbi:fimbrial assembly protein [Geobacter sp. OR-1]|uniref:PilN domain-containing protein n=1 Tax=Geobacter sp. OR-1 TaxID=1266765 RepID=UPI0005444ECD|nr:PilN domain-containing protein [Geobacter sp. OR-1]GAM10652.1 fimbrial assembly protein [Geobacter sp. OR-1]